jgi:hypothetical protein
VAINTSVSCPAATPNAGFTDIGAFSAEIQLAINCIAAFGITTGTTATTYSPNGTVLRWQMALFLVRQAADHGVTIPAPVSQGYTDIAGLPQATIDAINQVTQLGISKGTTSTTFSPNDVVTRWQMALFLHRLGIAAGISFSSTAGHNDFTDIGAFSAEIQGAINALADTRVDPQGHIVLGTGGSLFSPNDPVFRWAMALFLTRVLAADDIAAPAGLRVTVTPTDTVSLGSGTARTYSATFKNADGTPYTGAVGVRLFITSAAGVIEWDGAPAADDTFFEAPTDGLAGAGTTLIEGFPGADGIISFTVRHDGTPAERVVPVAWEDLDNDNSPEITGNNPPGEPHGIGGQVSFGAAVAAECAGLANPQVFSAATVTAVDKTADRIEVNPAVGFGAVPCSIFYDGATDLFRIEGAGTDVAGFEAALNVGDILGGTYDPDTADQSTLDITTDNDPALTVTAPPSCTPEPCVGTTVDAATFTITGTAVAGYTVRVYNDADDDEDPLDAEPLAGSTTAAADGTWSVVVNLTQGALNHFVAAQRPTPGGADGPLVNVPTISETAAAAPLITAVNGTNGGVASILDAGDMLVIDFNEGMQAPTAGDAITLLDNDGTRATLTCGSNGTSCSLTDSDTITVTAGTPTIGTTGSDGLLDWVAASTQIESASGYTGTDGNAVNVAGSGAGRIVGTTF